MSFSQMFVCAMSVWCMSCSQPNVCQSNGCKPNVCQPNVCQPNVCQPNVCQLNVHQPNVGLTKCLSVKCLFVKGLLLKIHSVKWLSSKRLGANWRDHFAGKRNFLNAKKRWKKGATTICIMAFRKCHLALRHSSFQVLILSVVVLSEYKRFVGKAPSLLSYSKMKHLTIL